MFSGLVAAVGNLGDRRPQGRGARLEVTCRLGGEPLTTGESIAVSGVCLTVVAPRVDGFAADLSAETLTRTTLGTLRPGSRVNLERALRLGDRLGGHLVLGHVDATVPTVAVHREQGSSTVRFAIPGTFAPEVAEKGSVAVDGVSLTVSRLGEGWFEVVLVPATLAATTLADVQPGMSVNLETDVLAKYVRRALHGGGKDLAALWEGFSRAES